MRAVGRALLALVALVAATAPALAACPGTAMPPPRETIPAPLDWAEWRTMVDALALRLRGPEVARAQLVFVGDSITQGWHPNVFQNFYGHRAAINLGIGGDTTQSLLWRLENGNWPARLQPQAIVLLVGTNNIGAGNRPEDVAAGVAQVIARLQRLAPQARILLLGVLPRGITAADPMRAPVGRLNQLMATCADGRRVFYTEPGALMLDGQGILFDWIAHDWLHLTMTGYAMLATAIELPLRAVLQR